MELDKVPEHLIIVGGGMSASNSHRCIDDLAAKLPSLNRVLTCFPKKMKIYQTPIWEDEGINLRFEAECIGGIQ